MVVDSSEDNEERGLGKVSPRLTMVKIVEGKQSNQKINRPTKTVIVSELRVLLACSVSGVLVQPIWFYAVTLYSLQSQTLWKW